MLDNYKLRTYSQNIPFLLEKILGEFREFKELKSTKKTFNQLSNNSFLSIFFYILELHV